MKWQRCEEGNPSEEFEVECLVSDGHIIKTGSYVGDGEWWGELGSKTKYWMELPALPEKQKEMF